MRTHGKSTREVPANAAHAMRTRVAGICEVAR
jgi:hypothetical protein